jgi:hypothetical protein
MAPWEGAQASSMAVFQVQKKLEMGAAATLKAVF